MELLIAKYILLYEGVCLICLYVSLIKKLCEGVCFICLYISLIKKSMVGARYAYKFPTKTTNLQPTLFMSSIWWDGSFNSDSIRFISSISKTVWIISLFLYTVFRGTSAFFLTVAQQWLWYNTSFAIASPGHTVEFNRQYLPLSDRFCGT